VHNLKHPEVLEEANLAHHRNQPVDCLELSSLVSNSQVLEAPVFSDPSNNNSSNQEFPAEVSLKRHHFNYTLTLTSTLPSSTVLARTSKGRQ